MRKGLKGSQTVEMSIVLPVILFVIISFIYLLFFLHDVTVLRAYAYCRGLEKEFKEENTTDIVNSNNINYFNDTDIFNKDNYYDDTDNINKVNDLNDSNNSVDYATEINELLIEANIKTIVDNYWIVSEYSGEVTGPVLFINKMLEDKVKESVKVYKKFNVRNMYILKCARKFIQNSRTK